MKKNLLSPWLIIILAGIAYLAGGIYFHGYKWIDTWLQVGGITLTLFVTIIIMRENNRQIDLSTKEQIKTYKEESKKQIDKLEENTKAQINTIQAVSAKEMEHLTAMTNKHIDTHIGESKKQIDKIEENTKAQISAIQAVSAKEMEQITILTNKHIGTHIEESKKQMDSIREATKEQIQSFVSQTEEITSRLEDVADQLAELAKLSGEMVITEKEIKRIEEESLRQRQADLLRQQKEIKESLERTMPQISYRLEQKVHLVFFKYINIYMYNGGGDASLLRFTISFKNSNSGKVKSFTFSFPNLKRGHQVDFQTGRVRHLQDCGMVQIEISAWDMDGREYYAHRIWNRQDYTWCFIPTDEKPKLIA